MLRKWFPANASARQTVLGLSAVIGTRLHGGAVAAPGPRFHASQHGAGRGALSAVRDGLLA